MVAAPREDDEHADRLEDRVLSKRKTGPTVTSLFSAQAARTATAIALEYGDERLTYRELDAWATRLAGALNSAGLGRGCVVGVLAEPGTRMVAGLLGCLKAGAAYVPLDPALPRARLDFVVRDAGVAAIVCDTRQTLPLSDLDRRVPVFDFRAGAAGTGDVTGDAPGPDDLAYVIYTSGSTGTPKGVEVTHASVANLLTCLGDIYALTPQDVGVLTHSFTFDASVAEMFTPLVHGGRLLIADGEQRRDPRALAALLAKRGVTIWDVVPAMLAQVLELPDAAEQCASVRLVVAGGDTLSPELVDLFFATLPKASLQNQYGPTEATVSATWFACAPGARDTTVPIGRPLAGGQIHLLDESGRPVRAGQIGEIYVGGSGVARGYRGRPELTAQRFIRDPFSDDPAARLYRTGDLGRWRADGALEFHGRVDRQLSIRGYRVEPDEVEAALTALPDVRASAVAARPGPDGAQRLIAWVCPRSGCQLTRRRLREQLIQALPHYMIPTHFVVLDELPLSTSGKTDYRALPDPAEDHAPLAPEVYGQPATPLQSALASLWSNVLNAGPVGVEDDFFELGGHSILATRMIARVRESLGIEVPVSAVFEQPTVAGIAAWIEREQKHAASGTGHDGPVPVDRNGAIPLSAAQEQVWILSKLLPGSTAYHTQAYLDVRGPVDHATLEEALTRIVARHEHLRTAFKDVGGEPQQVIQPPFRITVPVVDLTGEPEAIREPLALERMEEYVARRIDVGSPPLFRWVLFRLAPQRHLLLLVEHHFIHDGWSFGVLLAELADVYGALAEGREPVLPALPIQFADYALWQRSWLRGESAHEQLGYWRAALAGAPALLPLPTDRPRPKQQSPYGDTIQVPLPPDVYRGIRKIASANRSTGFMTMLAVFFALMHRWSGATDISVGSSIANRRHRATEPLIGMFINPVVMRADLSGDPTFRTLLKQVSKVAVDAYRNQDFPFPKLVESLNPKRDLSHNPLYQVAFSYHDARVPRMALGDAPAQIRYLQNHTAKHDLDVILIPRADQLAAEADSDGDEDVLMEWTYSTDLFDRQTILRMVHDFVEMAEDVARDVDTPVRDLARPRP